MYTGKVEAIATCTSMTPRKGGEIQALLLLTRRLLGGSLYSIEAMKPDYRFSYLQYTKP